MQGVALNTTRLEPLAPLEALPNEVLYRIVIKLDLHDLCSLRKCSTTLRDFVATADKIWQSMAQELICPTVGVSDFEKQVKTVYSKQIARDILRLWIKLYRCLFPAVPEETIWQWFGKPSQFNAFVTNSQEQLNTLTELNLTQGARYNFYHLPKQLCQLHNLRELVATGSQLRRFPSQLSALPKLEVLNLSNNLLRELPEGIPPFPSLTYLNISNNSLCRFPSLAAFPNLAVLNFSSNPMKFGSAGPLKLPPGLAFVRPFFTELPSEARDQLTVELGYPLKASRGWDRTPVDFFMDEMEKLQWICSNVPNRIGVLLDVKAAYYALTFGDAELLINFKRACDTIATWKKVRALLPEACKYKNIFLDDSPLVTAEDYLNLAAKFPQWVESCEADLANLPEIDLRTLEPIETPIELFTPTLIGKFICNPLSTWQDKTTKLISSYLGSPIENCEYFVSRLTKALSSQKDFPTDIEIDDLFHEEFIKDTLEGGLLRYCRLDKLRSVHDWVKARNTLDVWARLAEHLKIDPKELPDAAHQKTVKAEIEAAAKFPVWFEQHKDQLATLQALDLSYLNLFILPEEIGQLPGLKSLNLAGNSEMALVPKQIWDLPQLKELKPKENT